MLCEAVRDRNQRIRAYAAQRCALLGRRYTSRRARIYLRIAADDPPDHPARPPCMICTLIKPWSNAPPYNTRPAYAAGEPRAGPRLARRFVARGGDG